MSVTESKTKTPAKTSKKAVKPAESAALKAALEAAHIEMVPLSALVKSPIKGPAINSTIAASAEPLCPPNVSIAPVSSTTLGSVLGTP